MSLTETLNVHLTIQHSQQMAQHWTTVKPVVVDTPAEMRTLL